MSLNKSVNFKVNGIHCGGCANKIKNGIDSLNIENNVEVDVSSGKVNVKFNSEQSSVSLFKDCIIKAGFQVESIELE